MTPAYTDRIADANLSDAIAFGVAVSFLEFAARLESIEDAQAAGDEWPLTQPVET